MKKIIIISLVIIVLVGACTVTLFLNKRKIDEKAKLEGSLKTIPVFVTAISKSLQTGDFQVNGSFSAVHELTLMSEGQGKVTELFFNTGDFVWQDQILVRLDDEIIRTQLSLAEATLARSRSDMKKFEELLKEDAVSSQQVEDAHLALKKTETDVTTLRKQLEIATIKAPIQGTITRRFIEKGSLLMPGSPVAEIIDISRLKFIAHLAESETVNIKKGQRVTITSSLFPGIIYYGTIQSIGVKADEARRFPVEIELTNNPSHPLKAGMFGTADFRFGSTHEAIMVPRHSLVGSIRTPKVFVVEHGNAVLRDITIGNANDGFIEVITGLKEGELVVTSGQINLDNNTPVTIANQK
jgi:RND family efflux transporter MFP subunit